MNWTAKDIPPQTGRRAVVTGANSGIGFHTALELSRQGAEVILPARTEEKAADAIERIRREVPGARLISAEIDLASLASIRAFAGFYAENFPGPSLDLHINNAGIMALPRRELTIDGFERQFATNYLGPFALTAFLFPYLKRQVGTRIVTVASEFAHTGKIEFDNLQSERKYISMNGAYALSKLADVIFMRELQRRLTAAGLPIFSVGAHPGVAVTRLQRSLTGLYKILGPIFTPLIGQDAAQGALPTLYAATSTDVVAGGYYGPNAPNERKGYPAPARLPEGARDVSIAERLWSETERLVGITWPKLI